MRQQTALWTALPAGRTPTGQLRLSVLVSPRLFSDEALPATVAQFPDFAAWGETPVDFAVVFGAGASRPAAVVSPPVHPEFWCALLPPETAVSPYEFRRLDDRRIHSYPAGPLLSYLQGQYQVIGAAHPQDPPGLEVYSGIAHAIGGVPAQGEGGADQRDNPRWVFGLARQFAESLRRWRPEPQARPLDFHQVIASIGPYPEVLRLLGLVYDLEISADGVETEGTVRVEPLWTPRLAETRSLTPATRYHLDGQRFQAAPDPAMPMQENGFLRLGDPAYGVVQVDLDHAALRVTDFANAVVRLRHQKGGQKESLSLPSLHSAGLAVYQSGRAESVRRSLAEAALKGAAITAGHPTVLYAEDLVQGYRVDVWDAWSGRWHSLSQRVGRYRFPSGSQVVTREDEGYVTAGVSAPDGEEGDLYVPENLFAWDGWSLVAPRPDAQRPTAGAEPEPGHLEASFVAAPRSLPRLRFGGIYRIRARAVDLAGNSVPLETAEADEFAYATEPTTYGRFEPVDSPLLVLKEPLDPGETADVMVLRSDVDQRSPEMRERHVAPPPVTALTAEGHGKVSPPPIGRSSDADTAEPFPLGEVHPEEELALTYLPDPLSRGASFQGLPGMAPGQVQQVDFGELTWPDALPFRLRVMEGAGVPLWEPDERVLTIYLEKSQTAKVRLSSYLHADDLLEMGIWQWLQRGGLPAAKLVQLRELAAEGRHWMLTPYRELTLVHAVRQPLVPPAWEEPSISRGTGQTFATLLDKVTVHGRSTGRVAVDAVWDELVDDPGDVDSRVTVRQARVADVPVGVNDTTVQVKGRHEFGDTRYRKVRYSLVAKSRFASYFPDSPESSLTRTSVRPVSQEVLSSAHPPVPSVLWVEPLGAGGGWRVYLDRPWFASGAGELLGVVLAAGAKAGAAVQPPGGRSATTQWGDDLRWRASPNFPQPAVAHFSGAVTAAIGLNLPEVPAAIVVAGHDVTFDQERGVWHADVPVTSGHAGIVFARLALVRYQPHSLVGMHLSPLAQVSVARLPGGYTLTISPGTPPEEIALAVVGPGATGEQPADWVATVERKGEAGWASFGPSPAALAPASDPKWPENSWRGSVLVPAGEQNWRLVIEARAALAGPGLTGQRKAGTAVAQGVRQTLHRTVIEG